VLPTGLQADPYLKQVVSRTVEVSLRAKPAEGVQVSGALFRTINRDDIVFARAGATQAGYFTNVDRTRRQGLELAAQAHGGAWEWSAGYTWLDATYQTDGVLPGPLSTAVQPNTFTRGTRIAGLPRHVLKLAVDWRLAPRLSVGADWLVSGSRAVAGNESGTRPELGRVAGYSVINARLRWQHTDRWQFYLRVNNLLDKRYATFSAGNLDLFPAGAAVQAGSEPVASRFLAPGAPRPLTIGVRHEFDE